MFLCAAAETVQGRHLHHAADTVTATGFSSYYRTPLDLPLSLSGNYGEFRANHFHMGYDLRIGGVSGARLFAVADGFIVRISVSPSGYGNALYIEHPNGTTAVYGHLLDFAPAIQEYVKTKQYEQQSFAVNLALTSEIFPVKKGDFVGRAGNSGSSGGPHLHFEIRETTTQFPLNYSAYGLYSVADRTPPRLTRLQVYSYGLQSGIPRTALIKTVNPGASAAVIPVSDTFYVAMDAYDRMEGSHAFLALAKYELFIDDAKVYAYRKTEVPLSMGRYLNSFLQYDQRVAFNRALLKTWLEPGNAIRNPVTSSTGGLFTLSDTLAHNLKIVLTDDYGNESAYQYKIARSSSLQKTDCPVKGKAVLWAMDNYYEADGIQLYLPFGALAKNTDLRVACAAPPSLPQKTVYAPLWRIGSPSEPLFRPMRLAIYAQVPDALKEKALIVSVSKEGKYMAAGGRWKGDFLETSTYVFGDYTVTVDTIPPQIAPRFKTADFRGAKQMAFHIKDDLSGIKSFQGVIDGEWALFVHDAKYGSLIYTFDKTRIGSGKRHQIELIVTDNCNNISIYKTLFTW